MHVRSQTFTSPSQKTTEGRAPSNKGVNQELSIQETEDLTQGQEEENSQDGGNGNAMKATVFWLSIKPGAFPAQTGEAQPNTPGGVSPRAKMGLGEEPTHWHRINLS